MRLTSLVSIETLARRWNMEVEQLEELVESGQGPKTFTNPAGETFWRGSDILDFESKHTQ